VKSVLVNSVLVCLYALAKYLSQIWGPFLLGPHQSGGTGVIPPALDRNSTIAACVDVQRSDLFLVRNKSGK